jgi:hypothetical protein
LLNINIVDTIRIFYALYELKYIYVCGMLMRKKMKTQAIFFFELIEIIIINFHKNYKKLLKIIIY